MNVKSRYIKLKNKKGERTMDLKKVIKEVVEHSGGQENLRSVVHCATRLRLE